VQILTARENWFQDQSVVASHGRRGGFLRGRHRANDDALSSGRCEWFACLSDTPTSASSSGRSSTAGESMRHESRLIAGPEKQIAPIGRNG
jgi:hypothetical protein